MAIDSAIDNYYAAGLREEKNKAKSDDAEQPMQPGGSLRQRLAMARNLKERTKEAAKDKIKSAVMSPVKQGTSILLKASWTNLIDSFGLTLIYINIHVLLRWIFPSMFCKLGEEWMPKQASVLNGGVNQASGASRTLGIAELASLLILDILVFFIILAVTSIIVMIADFIMNPSKLITTFLGLDWTSMKDLANLFW